MNTTASTIIHLFIFIHAKWIKMNDINTTASSTSHFHSFRKNEIELNEHNSFHYYSFILFSFCINGIEWNDYSL